MPTRETARRTYVAYGESDAAASALVIRPCDTRAVAALREFARWGEMAGVQRGAIMLAGMRQPAWLAFSQDGRLLAAVLIGGQRG